MEKALRIVSRASGDIKNPKDVTRTKIFTILQIPRENTVGKIPKRKEYEYLYMCITNM